MTSSALALIELVASTRERVQQSPMQHSQLQALQRWQIARLQRTYADFAAQPRYREALDFFAGDLYGPHEYAQRDRDLKKILHQWERRLPQRARQAVICALELEVLTLQLDLDVLAALAGASPDESSYPLAYCQANRRDDRQRQIWLTVAAGRALDALIHLPVIGVALRMARLPARLAGVTVLHQFLERGHAAFATMGNAQELLRAIEQRETQIMQRLFAGSADPFALAADRSASRVRRR